MRAPLLSPSAEREPASWIKRHATDWGSFFKLTLSMGEIFNRKNLEKFRKELRNHSTSAEATLWLRLKNKQLDGRRFRRQFSVGNYILDFYCPAEKLAVELDGNVHFTEEGLKYDAERDRYLQSIGIRTIRFENRLVFENVEEVISEIKKKFGGATPPPVGHLPLAGEEK
jgi:very-short-patch-repair endonuclease